ncbi:MAG: class I SAM-dependent methyltransferase, partial [Pseudomonadota bacterium]
MNGTDQGGGLLLRDAAAFYDRVAPFFDREYAFGPDVTLRQTAWLAGHCPPGPLLDLGCGSGRMLASLRRAGFAPVAGLDCSPAMLALARAACPEAPLVRADAAHGLPFADASFGLIVSLHSSLIHICDPAHMARLIVECRRVLKPGGRLIVEAPHPCSYPPDAPPGRWRRFSPGILCRRVEPGLEELCIEDLGGLRTRVLRWEIADLRQWFQGWAAVELHPGFSGGRFDPGNG